MIKLPVHVIEMDGGFARLQGADLWISPGVLAVDEAHQIAKALNAHPAAAAVVSGDWHNRMRNAITMLCARNYLDGADASDVSGGTFTNEEIDGLLDEAVAMPEPDDSSRLYVSHLVEGWNREHMLQLAAALVEAATSKSPMK
jgi:hypothetical protein